MRTGSAFDASARRAAATAVLEAYREGRPIEEIRLQLPEELEATGQAAAAAFVRTFFMRPERGSEAGPSSKASGRQTET